MFIEFLTAALVTMLVTLDPPGLAPIFLSLTRGMSGRAPAGRDPRLHHRLLHHGVLRVAGDVVLKALGVSLPAFRIAGGLAAVLDLVRDGVRAPQRAQAADRRDRDHAGSYPQCRGLSAGDPADGGAGRADGDDAAGRPGPRRPADAGHAGRDLRAGGAVLSPRVLLARADRESCSASPAMSC
jgi:multiple antibiotic resistance protein